MVLVKKRDGRKVPFVPEKIVVSMIKTGAATDYGRTITQDIERGTQDGITTLEIRAKAFAILKAKNPEWGRNWTVYDSAVKKRTG